jgi:xanthine dehydrogenase YagS FAD-binding subunit
MEITDDEGKMKEVDMEDFFVLPENDSSKENVLNENELITAVIIPPVKSNTRSYYIKQGTRESHDWAIADVAFVAEVSGQTCKNAEIVLGAAAPIPVKAKEAAKYISGKELNDSNAASAGEMAMKEATPLAKNAYKVPLFKAIIKRAILKTV